MPTDRHVASEFSYPHRRTHGHFVTISPEFTPAPNLNTLIHKHKERHKHKDTQAQRHKHIRRYINTLQLHRHIEIAHAPPSHPVSRETRSQECPEWGQAGLGLVPCSRDETRKPSAPGAQGRGSAGEKNTRSFVPLPTPPQAAKLLRQASLDKAAMGVEGSEREGGLGSGESGRVHSWQGGLLAGQELRVTWATGNA